MTQENLNNREEKVKRKPRKTTTTRVKSEQKKETNKVSKKLEKEKMKVVYSKNQN